MSVSKKHVLLDTQNISFQKSRTHVDSLEIIGSSNTWLLFSIVESF